MKFSKYGMLKNHSRQIESKANASELGIQTTSNTDMQKLLAQDGWDGYSSHKIVDLNPHDQHESPNDNAHGFKKWVHGGQVICRDPVGNLISMWKRLMTHNWMTVEA